MSVLDNRGGQHQVRHQMTFEHGGLGLQVPLSPCAPFGRDDPSHSCRHKQNLKNNKWKSLILAFFNYIKIVCDKQIK